MILTILDDQSWASCMPVSVNGQERNISVAFTRSGSRQGAKYEMIEFFFLNDGKISTKVPYTGELVGMDVRYVPGTYANIEALRECFRRQQLEGG